jgi:membrane protein YdbS with pleckstrin-like domain
VGFARKVLDDDEEVLAELRPHVVFVAAPVLLVVGAIALAVAIAVLFPNAPVTVAWVLGAMVLLPALWSAARLLRWRAIRFLVTTNRLVYRRGVFGRDVVQLRLQRVAEVHCTQSVFGRMVGCGRLVFEVAAGDGPLVVEDVRRPRSVQRLITRRLDEMEPAYGQAWPQPAFATSARVAHAQPASTLTQQVPAIARQVPAMRRQASPARLWDDAPTPTWSDTPPHGLAGSRAGGTSGGAPGPTGGTAPGVAGTQQGIDFTPASVPGRLVQLDELRRRGIISQEEFVRKKAELLQRL